MIMDYIEELKKNPIQIENFLSEKTANEVYDIIDLQTNWKINSLHKRDYDYEKSKFLKGEFSYWYHNIIDLDLIYTLLEKLNFQEELNKVLNSKSFTPQSIFISKYTDGNFLSAHNDKSEGRKYAFVYNLTKDANYEKGGCLHFIDENKKITHKLLPKFNSLNIFDVINTKDEHYVSEVVDKSFKRYSISGWITQEMKIEKTLL